MWDFPRPPNLKADSRLVEVRVGADIIARTSRAFRLCETASPPTFYLPPRDVNTALLLPARGASICEWKGRASYWAHKSNTNEPVGWTYPKPRARYRTIGNYFAFYPARVECFVDGERVEPQPGRFYGGWITSDVVGPFKGEPGTGHW